jgi:predicted nucleic acid-binding protein
MSVPTNIFIDTSILDEQNYNFSSRAIKAFVEAAEVRKAVLLLPDPTRREIERHIENRSQEVVKVLGEAKRKAPFLKKWKAWPVKRDDFALDYELRKIAMDEWEHFLKHFDVEELDYTGISIEEVMNWYDYQQAPFGSGSKRREFPDALALAALLAYQKKKGVPIAVVSKDRDFQQAIPGTDTV